LPSAPATIGKDEAARREAEEEGEGLSPSAMKPRHAAAFALVDYATMDRGVWNLLSNPCNVPVMKSRRDVEPRDQRPCQRPECLNMGMPRLQPHQSYSRVIYLCHECFGSLPVDQLNDLFVYFTNQHRTRRRSI
jgi:hypothetical protein